MNLFKQYSSHMKSLKFLKVQRSEEMGKYEECEDSSHSSYSCEFFSIFGFGFSRISFDHLPKLYRPSLLIHHNVRGYHDYSIDDCSIITRSQFEDLKFD